MQTAQILRATNDNFLRLVLENSRRTTSCGRFLVARCLNMLMALMRRDGQWQEGRARRALMAVFETLRADHELVRGNRNELYRLIH